MSVVDWNCGGGLKMGLVARQRGGGGDGFWEVMVSSPVDVVDEFGLLMDSPARWFLDELSMVCSSSVSVLCAWMDFCFVPLMMNSFVSDEWRWMDFFGEWFFFLSRAG
ncbi:hypothetical protein Droror1_Dr00007870 [Drosera rotundifolia]